MTGSKPRDTASGSPEITDLLVAWGNGDDSALNRLVPLVHQELRRLARRQMAGEHPGHTLQTTALVNEAYLRLVDLGRMRWQDRGHFLGMSARLMRRILVDHARVRRARKRGGADHKVPLEQAASVSTERAVDLIAMDDALDALAAIDSRKSQVVEMRFFGGLSIEETAKALDVSPETVKRDWRVAKVWLLRELDGRHVR